MITSAGPVLRQFGVAVRALLLATALLGVGYPLVVTGISRVAFPDRAVGSLVQADGRTVGSRLIGQAYDDPAWFHTRPSAVDYDGLSSGASQRGPNSPELIAAIDQRRADIAREERVDPARVPADAVTSSGSGLDPEISPAYADLQVDRVARNRGLRTDQVRSLVSANTSGRTWGFLGEPRVNVVQLNADLAALR